MTSTLCQSAALGRIIATWVVMIAELSGIIVETFLSMAERSATPFRKAGWPGLPHPDTVTLVLPGLDDAAGCVRLADLGAAPARITETAVVDRDVFLTAARMFRGKVIGFEES